MKKVLIIFAIIIAAYIIFFIMKVFFFSNVCGVAGCNTEPSRPSPCVQDDKGNCLY